MQYEINHIVAVLIKHGVFPAVKHVLTANGFDVGHCAFPTKRLTEVQQTELMRDLAAVGFSLEK